MRKRRGVLAFLLGMIILLESGMGIRAAETGNDAVEDAWEQNTQEQDAWEQDTQEQDAQERDTQEQDENVQGFETYPEEDAAGEDNPELSEDEEPEMDLELEEYIKEAQNALGKITAQDSIMALIYLCDNYEVKREPSLEGETVVRVPSGTTVLIKGVDTDEEYNIWYQVAVEYNGSVYTGYVDRSYLAYSNEIFMEWEDNYFPQIAVYAAYGGGYPDIEQFPASYRDKLVRLKQAHPNWIFVKQNTGLDWKNVVSSENDKDRSLISSKMGAAYRGNHHSPGWYYASEDAVKYYLDPRNFLDDVRVFQFEQLTYNSSYHSKAAVQNILDSTFMKGALPGAGMTYADAFFQVGVSLKVSPFHLACRVYQEQGEGKSALISGSYSTVPEYVGYYNYFNIGASGTTTKQVVESGLARAVKEGWNSPFASIKGGSVILSKNYILRGQDTLYLQKFDVDASDGTLYTHQYMQNIMAPYSESQMVKTAYSKVNALDNPFVFKIPVYLNMPERACPAPSQTTAPTSTPTAKPTVKPTAAPTAKPTAAPTAKPTATPTVKPTATPTAKPTATPTVKPTAAPTAKPTVKPTATPTVKPTAKPTAAPTAKATVAPTAKATAKPTAVPTVKPTEKPTAAPTAEATVKPTAAPTAELTATPTTKPTVKPTAEPTAVPTVEPASLPTVQPVVLTPTEKPTQPPVLTPAGESVQKPDSGAEAAPTQAATATPTAKAVSASTPIPAATASPSAKAVKASASPTAVPSVKPVVTPAPAADPKHTSDSAPAAPVSENQTVEEDTVAASGENTQSAAANFTISPAPVENEPATAGTQENTTSSQLTIAAVTPQPQTAAEDKNVVSIDMSETGVVYGEALKRIKERGTEVTLEMNDRISWTIDGSTIESDDPEDVNLGVKLGTSRIPKRILNALTKNEQYIEMSLDYDGAFGFTAKLSVKIDNALPGQYANLFYYNEEEMAFEFMCASLVSSTGRADYEFKHASDYVIIVSDVTKEHLLQEQVESLDAAREILNTSEELPAEEPRKAAGIIALICLGSAALVIGAYLLLKK